MRELANKIEEFARRKKQRRILAGASTLLALAVIAIVMMSLTKPAISLSSDDDTKGILNDFEETTAINLNGKISDPKVEGDTVQTSGKEGETVSATVVFDYKLDDNSLTSETPNKYVYLQLDTQIEAEKRQGIVEDKKYSDYLIANNLKTDSATGDYFITEDGKIIIKFRDAYLDWLGQSGTGVTGGTFELVADFTRGEDKGQTEYDFNIGGSTVTVGGFTAKTLGVQKSAVDNGDGTATWTITLNDPASSLTDDYYLVDEMLASANSTITVTDANGTQKTISAHNNNTIWASDLKDSSGSYSSKYIITYTTKFTYDNATYDSSKGGYYSSKENTVNLAKGTETVKTDTAVVSHTSKVTLSKTTDSSKDYDYDNGKITWHITVKNPDGLNLNGMTLTDSAFNGITINNISTTSQGGVSVPECSLSGDTLKFTTDSTADLFTINYTVDAVENEDGTNYIELKDKEDNKLYSTSAWYSFNAIDLDKSGKVNKSDSIINWTVTIETKQLNLNGYVFTDNMLLYAVEKSLTIKDANGNDISYTKNDNKTYTITDTSSQKAYITYSTPLYVDEDNTNGGKLLDDGESVTYSNTATVGIGETTETFTTTVTDKPINVVKKSSGTTAYNDDYTEFTTNWTVDLEQDPGSYNAQVFTDTMDLPSGFSIKTITTSISGTTEAEAAVTLTENSDYTVDKSSIAQGILKVSFSDNSNVSTLYKCCISYQAVLTVDTGTIAAGTDIVIKNTAAYNGKTAEANVTYRRPDLTTPPCTKTVDGKEDLKLSTADLQSYKEGAYYIFTYVISVDYNSGDLKRDGNYYVFEDTLPENFELCTDKDLIYYVGGWSDTISTSGSGTTYYYDYDSTSRIIKFYFTDYKIGTITYSAKVSCNVVDEAIKKDGSFTAVNSVKHADYEPAKQQITVSSGTTTDEGIINKSGIALETTGYYQYSIDVNTDAKQLVADGETLTLIDTMTCSGYTNDEDHTNVTAGTNTEFTPDLSYIKIVKINDDGTDGEEIDGYKYTLATNVEKSILPDGVTNQLSEGTATVTNPWAWPTTEYQFKSYSFEATAGNSYKLDIYPNSASTVGTYNTFPYTLNGAITSTAYAGAGYDSSISAFSVTVTATDNGTAELYFKGWDNSDYTAYIDKIVITEIASDGSQTENSWGSVSTITEALARLTITGLPDATPLRIIYTYKAVTEDTSDYAAASVTNSALLNGTGQNSTSSNWFTVSQKSSATSTGEQYISLEKVDVGNYSLSLSAGFNLYKYDANTKSWIPATGIAKPTGNNSAKYYEVNWGENSDVTPAELVKEAGTTLNLSLEKSVLYKIYEKEEPDDFSNIDEYFGKRDGYTDTFYFCFMTKPDDIPDNVTDYKVINSNGKYQVQNVKKVDVTVTKNWAGLSSNYKDSVKAEFELYRTTDLSLLDSKSIERVDLNKFVDKSATYVDYDNDKLGRLVLTSQGSSQVIKDLPNGEDDNGKAYYYYIKEVRYTLDGSNWVEVNDNSDYQPFYSGNYTNGDSTITVTNASDLTIKKIWKDSDGIVVNDTSKKPGIEVQLYRIIYNGNEPADDEIYTESNLVGTYKLNNVNNYEAVIKTGELSGYNDTDAQKYRYYVKEITDISDNTVSYYNNGTDGVAVITVTNKSTVTETASYVLPSTGSVGTRKLLIAGIALVSFGLAAVGIKLKRRNYEN
jgi:hypothetical protein